MVVFAESEHNRSMRRYESRCLEAKASDRSARAERRKSIEDSLVSQGLEGVEKYEATLEDRWRKAKCLAEYDGISMGYAIAKRARARLAKGG